MNKLFLFIFLATLCALGSSSSEAGRGVRLNQDSVDSLARLDQAELLITEELDALEELRKQYGPAATSADPQKKQEAAEIISRAVSEASERFRDIAKQVAQDLSPGEFNELVSRLLVRYVKDIPARTGITSFLVNLLQEVKPELDRYKAPIVADNALSGAMTGMAVVALAQVAKEVGEVTVFRNAKSWLLSWGAKPSTAIVLQGMAPPPSRIARAAARFGGPWRLMFIGVGVGASIGALDGLFEMMETKKLNPLLALGAVQGFILLDQFAIEACLFKQEANKFSERRVEPEAALKELRGYAERLGKLKGDLEALESMAPAFVAEQPLVLVDLEKLLKEKGLAARLQKKSAVAANCSIGGTPAVAFDPIKGDLEDSRKIFAERAKNSIEILSLRAAAAKREERARDAIRASERQYRASEAAEPAPAEIQGIDF